MLGKKYRYEHDDYDGEHRYVVKTPEGQTTILPRSARRLRGEQLEAYARLMHVGVEIARLEEQVEELVQEARELGVSWALIGAAVGVTSEGARVRYGRVDDD